MNLPIIQSLWIGAPLSAMEKLCIASFTAHGHDFHLYTYRTSPTQLEDNPPPTARGEFVVKSAYDILPEEEIFTYKGGSVAGFADWFRYELLYEKGGAWVDMDICCLRPLAIADDLVLATEYNNAGTNFTNALIIAAPQHRLIGAMRDFCRKFPKKQGAKFGAVGGPRVLQKIARELDCERFAKPPPVFLPIAHDFIYTAFDNTYADSGGDLDGILGGAYTLHFYNEYLRRREINKDAQFAPDSLFEQLKTRYGITNSPYAEKYPRRQWQTYPPPMPQNANAASNASGIYTSSSQCSSASPPAGYGKLTCIFSAAMLIYGRIQIRQSNQPD